MKSKNNSGFTLIELMMVIAIIGILSMVGVPQYVVYSKRAKFVAVVVAAGQIRNSIEMCLLTESDSSSCNSPAKVGFDPVDFQSNDQIDAVQISEPSPGTVAIEMTASAELNHATYVVRGTYSPTTSTVIWLVDPGSSCLIPSYRYCSD